MGGSWQCGHQSKAASTRAAASCFPSIWWEPLPLPRLGSHNVYNALAVIAAANRLGVPEEDILMQLASVPSAARRLEPKVKGGGTIFDGPDNMNPEPARSALQAMAGLCSGSSDKGGKSGRSIVVFGGMLELGSASLALHHKLGEQVMASGQDMLVCVGDGGQAIAEGALGAGMDSRAVTCVPDIGAAYEYLAGVLRAGERAWCKAARPGAVAWRRQACVPQERSAVPRTMS